MYRKIIQIGPDSSAQGGIAAVLGGYAQHRADFEQLGYHLIFISSGAGAARGRIRKFLMAWCRLVWLLSFSEVHLVHIHSSIKGSLLRKSVFALTCAALGKGYVIHVHSGAFPPYFADLPRVTQIFIRFITAHAVQVICLSAFAKEQLVLMGLVTVDKCSLIYNGVTDPGSAMAARRDAAQHVTITFLGKISETKGLFTLLQAIATLPQSAVRYTLYIGGVGDDSVLSEWISSCGLGKCVVYEGWISGERKMQLLANTQIFVLPSRSEGFPVAIVEAMAFGLALVSTRIPGVVDAIRSEEDGLLVEPGDIEGLRDALWRLLSDVVLCERLGASARERFLEHFTIQETVRRLTTVYSNAAG